MTVVRIIKDWDFPNLYRQTPKCEGIWNDIKFTLDPVDDPDYVVVLNRTKEDVWIHVSPENVWQVTQEPPAPQNEWRWAKRDAYARVYTQNLRLKEPNIIYSQPALPWHINKTYDQLKQLSPIDKPYDLSWITSTINYMDGHQHRLDFLSFIKEKNLNLHLWGKGIQYIEDKWDGIAPYKYSLAVENYSGDYYWSEKLADCYLSWTMPIYYGCTNIEDYFPSESMIKIDIMNPKESLDIIEDAVKSNYYLKYRDAIAYAREQILEKYQFFPFISEKIVTNPSKNKIQTFIPTIQRPTPPPQKVSLLRKIKGKIKWIMKSRLL